MQCPLEGELCKNSLKRHQQWHGLGRTFISLQIFALGPTQLALSQFILKSSLPRSCHNDATDARPADSIAFQIPHILYTDIVCHKFSAAAEPALLN